jgi:hypothetical protein
MAYISYSGHYVRIDKSGKQQKTFNIAQFNFGVNGAHILPGDRVIVSFSNNVVREYTSDAKAVWEASGIQYPLIPYRASNGNTVLSGNSQRTIYEIDSRGKIVKKLDLNQMNAYRVTKR